MTNKLKLYLLIIITIFSFNNDVYGHGGEAHGEIEHNESSSPIKKDTSVLKSKKILNTKNGVFKLVLEQIPKVIYENEKVNFKFYISEVIENSFIEPENIKVKELTVNTDDFENISTKTDVNNVYSFSTYFSKTQNLSIKLKPQINNNNDNLIYEFNIKVISLPINYFAYTVFLLIIIILIIYTYTFLKKSKNINQKVLFILVNSLIGFLSFLLIKSSLDLRLKPEIKQDNKDNSILTNTNEIYVNKETQLLFDINIETINKKKSSDYINIFGSIKPFSQNVGDIITPVSGRVFLNNLYIGQLVNKNQNLGYIEQTLSLPEQLALKTNSLDLKLKVIELESKIKSSENNLDNANKEYNRANIDYKAKNTELNKQLEKIKLNIDLAQKEFLRVNELYKDGSASLKRLQESENNLKILKKDFDALKNQSTYILGNDSLKRLREVELRLKNDKQNLILAKNQLEQISKSNINIQNKRFDLISPISGVITQINTSYGNQEEQNKLVVNIVNNQKILIEGEVLEKDISKINNSKTGEFKVNSYPNKTFKLDGFYNKFITLGNSVDLDKRTIPIMFEIDNKDNLFKEGMFANISLDISNDSKNISIPKSSLSQENGRYFVYVYKDSELFEKREIFILNQNQEYVTISKGLEEDEKIAIRGIYQLNSLMIGKK